MTNPESSVVADIDALIDECLAPGPVDDYSVNRYDLCDTCRSQWHGLEDEDNGCPGAFATDEETEAFRSRYALPRPARPGVPYPDSWGPSELPTGTLIDGSVNVDPNFGYTLADLEGMRGGFSPARPGAPWVFPRVRFWCTDEDGTLRQVEGTLQIGSLGYSEGQMSIQGSLLPPVIQRMIPLREQSVSDALQGVLEDADLTVSCQTWVRGQEETQDPRPVGTLQDGLVSLEAAMAPGAEFESLGFISPDSLEIEHDQEYVQHWGGRTVLTRSEYSVRFDAAMDRGPAWDALFGGSPP